MDCRLISTHSHVWSGVGQSDPVSWNRGEMDRIDGRIGCTPANGCQAARSLREELKNGETQENQHGRRPAGTGGDAALVGWRAAGGGELLRASQHRIPTAGGAHAARTNGRDGHAVHLEIAGHYWSVLRAFHLLAGCSHFYLAAA